MSLLPQGVRATDLSGQDTTWTTASFMSVIGLEVTAFSYFDVVTMGIIHETKLCFQSHTFKSLLTSVPSLTVWSFH